MRTFLKVDRGTRLIAIKDIEQIIFHKDQSSMTISRTGYSDIYLKFPKQEFLTEKEYILDQLTGGDE